MDQHFILHEDLLNFQPLHTTHTGRHIAQYIFDSLCEFGIQNKLFCITTDNASNNYKMIKELSFLLRDNDCILWPGDSRHIPCLAHVLNLAVQAFLKKLNIAPMTEEEEWMLKSSDEDDDDDHDDSDAHRRLQPQRTAPTSRSTSQGRFGQTITKLR